MSAHVAAFLSRGCCRYQNASYVECNLTYIHPVYHALVFLTRAKAFNC